MSQENVDLVRRGIQDVEAFWALLDEHVVWNMRATMPPIDLPEVVVGRDAVIEGSRHYFGTWTDYRLDPEEVIDAGASVVLVVHEHARGRGSGVPHDWRFAQVWTFHRGKVIRGELFPDKAAALDAIRLRE
jgi:ketosteroid isomerase-like protein